MSEPHNAPPPQTVPDRDRNEEGRPENARPRDRFGAPLPRDAADELPDRVEPEDVCESLAQTVERGAELFDEQRFFEAHEFFEFAWKGPFTEDDDRAFYKGLAQLAVGYTHTQRGNKAGALALLERGVANVTAYARAHHGVDVARATADAEDFVTVLADTEPSPELDFPAFPRHEGSDRLGA